MKSTTKPLMANLGITHSNLSTMQTPPRFCLAEPENDPQDVLLILLLVVKPAQFQILLGIKYTILDCLLSNNVSLIEQKIQPN